MNVYNFSRQGWQTGQNMTTTTTKQEQPELLGVRAFARFIGRSPAAVEKWLKAGRIPRDESGKIPLQAALLALETLETSKPWAHVADEKPAALEGKKATAAKSAQSGGAHAELLRAKIKGQELANAAKQLELERMRGELVPLADVLSELRKAHTAVRSCLDRIPAAAPRLEGKPAEVIEATLRDELNRAFEELQKLPYK